MNRREDESKRRLEIFRQKLRRDFSKAWEDNRRASNMADPKRPVRREADSTDLRRVENYLNHVRAIFRSSPSSPTTIQIKPRPISVGTQTWATTHFKPLLSPVTSAPIKVTKLTTPLKITKPIKLTTPIKVITPSMVITPIKVTTASKSKVITPNYVITPMKATTASKFTTPNKVNTPTEEPMNSEPSTGVKYSAGTKSVKNKGKRPKTVGFNFVTKKGRYDHATTKRSVSPIFDAEPSDPFQ